MENKNTRGSEWRKWDLHIHTPLTKLNNNYKTEDKSDLWELYCNKIEQSDVIGFGITDYFSVDNYFVFIEKFSKLFPNSTKVFFPNIEFRLEVSVNLKAEEVNLHVIFSNIIPKIKIDEFLRKLDTNITFNAAKVSCKSLNDSQTSSASIDYKQLRTKLKEVFGNDECYLIFAAANNQGLRPDNESLRKLIITDEIDKVCDGFFGGSQNVDHFFKLDRFENNEQSLPKPVLSCSDAHSFDEIENWLGKQFVRRSNGSQIIEKNVTWIKADPTFEGLKQIIYEPEDRIFIGDEPELLKRVKNNKTKYIRSLVFKKTEDSNLNNEIWFDKNAKINVNPGFVSIIGNKGSGKSALADTFGLLGDTKQSSHFSFLNESKFKSKKDNKAKHFNASIEWESGDISEKNLNDEVNENAVETIKCIPQNYLESICTEQLEGSLFNDELKKVIFSHISNTEKLNFNTLDDLIRYKTKEKSHTIEIAKSEIAKFNIEIATLEIKLHPDYRTLINNKLHIKKQEKIAHERVKPVKPEEKRKPQTGVGQQKETEGITVSINEKVEKIIELEKEIARLDTESKSDYEKYISSKKLLDKLDNFQKQYDLFKSECAEIAKILSINIDDIISFEIKKNDIQQLNEDSLAGYKTKSDMLKEDRADGPFSKKQLLQKEIDTLRDKLDQPNKEYQKFLKEKAEWEAKLKTIDGDELTVDTIKFYKKQLADIDAIPTTLEAKKLSRLSKTLEIHKQLSELRDEYSSLYEPVKDFIDNHAFAKKDKFSMDFRVSIICAGFSEQFFNFVAQNKRGSFYGADDSRKKLKEILDGSDFDSSSGLNQFLEKIEEYLRSDKREDFSKEKRYIADQLRQDAEIDGFYNFIYSLDYLKPEYILQWAGKDLNQLSPGERGTVLLIFYLFISKENTPLVIDQPEGNLDNETVYGVLRPCIKLAKKRRQIIVVTHNPNLAVVCDADQVIHCEMKKEENNKITYTSGAIENPAINKALIDILEGTRPAFNKRGDKYYADKGK